MAKAVGADGVGKVAGAAPMLAINSIAVSNTGGGETECPGRENGFQHRSSLQNCGLRLVAASITEIDQAVCQKQDFRDFDDEQD